MYRARILFKQRGALAPTEWGPCDQAKEDWKLTIQTGGGVYLGSCKVGGVYMGCYKCGGYKNTGLSMCAVGNLEIVRTQDFALMGICMST